MDKRVWQLIRHLKGRTNLKDTVDLAECLAHWSYDFMVSRELYSVSNYLADMLVGRNGVWRMQ